MLRWMFFSKEAEHIDKDACVSVALHSYDWSSKLSHPPAIHYLKKKNIYLTGGEPVNSTDEGNL